MPKLSKQKRRTLIAVAIAVVALGTALAIKLNQSRKKATPSSTEQANKTAPNSANPNNETRGPQTDNSPTNPSLPTDPKSSGPGLAKPGGQLVSNHSISLSSTAPESRPDEVSTCQTVAGATCDIRLTNGGTVKYLGSKTVDAQGGAEFVWNAKNLGLVAGKWTVEAVATKAGQTAVSAPDYLEISP